MKTLSVLVLLVLAFFLGRTTLNKPTPIEHEFERISKEDLADYLRLKEDRDKFEAANKILAKIMKIFIADLGIRSMSQPECAIRSEISGSPDVTKAETSSTKISFQDKQQTKSDIDQAAKTISPPPAAAEAKTKTEQSPKKAIIPAEKAKGAVHALYQAVLWRPPDVGGGAEATNRFSEKGWQEYLGNARAMVQSPEFLKDVEPNHTSQEIINHMYAVYFGRCAFKKEMQTQMDNLRGDGPGRVITSIISSARAQFSEQIFSGGFPPNSCAN